MKPENIQDIYELSPIQQGILFHCIYAPKSGFYFVQKLFSLNGNLNFVAFDRAWKKVVDRHPSLRTGFYWEDINKPLQVVYDRVKVAIDRQDWRGFNPVEQQKRLESFMEKDLDRGFDLSQESLMRLTLICLSDRSYKFIWSSHFIILDGWSVMFVLKDFIQFYEAFCQDRDISLPAISHFKNHITWLQQQDSGKAEVFWRQALKGLKTPTFLKKLYVDNSSNQEKRHDHQRIFLSEIKTAALTSFTRQHQITLNSLIQAAWALLISHYSGEKKVLYGYTTAGRSVDLSGSDSMVGTLVNSLPVWVEI
ncbi:MAG: condensation domain-containing protein, partial [Xenococcaceae cyanobacterium]